MYSLDLIEMLIDAVKKNEPLANVMGCRFTSEKKFDGVDTLIRVTCIKSDVFQWDAFAYANRPMQVTDLNTICVNKAYNPRQLDLLSDVIVAFDPNGMIYNQFGPAAGPRRLGGMPFFNGQSLNQMAGFGANPYSHPSEMRFGDVPFLGQFGDYPAGPQIGMPARDTYGPGFVRQSVFGQPTHPVRIRIHADVALYNLMKTETRELHNKIITDLSSAVLVTENWTYVDPAECPFLLRSFPLGNVTPTESALIIALVGKHFAKLGYEAEVGASKDEFITVQLGIEI